MDDKELSRATLEDLIPEQLKLNAYISSALEAEDWLALRTLAEYHIRKALSNGH